MKTFVRVAILFVSLFLVVYLVRLTNLREIDDVHPAIPCKESDLNEAEVLFVIPKFNNQSIADNKNWCEYILSLNKTLGMHGVYHSYNEFGYDRNQEYLQEGVDIFEECFGFKPEIFKAPQLNISESNKILISDNIKLVHTSDQVFSKVYHCSDTGFFNNDLMRWI